MRLTMIRHGMTKGNREGRYVGSTDEELLPEAAFHLKTLRFPKAEKIYVSPMKRCIQTAEILYPDQEWTIAEEFRECDFGFFEYRNYQELNGNPAYQLFIDTMGQSGFPGGESREIFQKRCVQGFERILQEDIIKHEDVAFVVHGGTIMALLDWYSNPHRDYYEWQVKNGTGYTMEVLRDEKTGRTVFWDIQKAKADLSAEGIVKRL